MPARLPPAGPTGSRSPATPTPGLPGPGPDSRVSPNDANAPERNPAAPRRRRGLRLVVACVLVVYFLAGIGFLVVRHWVWPRLDQWRPAIEARLSNEIGAPVHLGRLQGDFDSLRPRLQVDGVEIGGAGRVE